MRLIESVRTLVKRDILDRHDTGCDSHALDATRLSASLENGKSALDCRADQLILISWLFDHEWRSNVKDISRACHCVCHRDWVEQVGLNKLHLLEMFAQGGRNGRNLRLISLAAHGTSDAVLARLEAKQGSPRAYIARDAGDCDQGKRFDHSC